VASRSGKPVDPHPSHLVQMPQNGI